ncbi:unnamed protein product [Fusarium graminearum]|uniref:Chromosome 2, complete genome n=1 Tax=Gibberella zeae (strain ATCC MYA-4620 / CBS 123657 / FGSC 9075 / NRRL 31084 / PH-1) TaxID=229533 RepID=A0A098DEM1_GIBZE|nr:unnamed protein product [Fusarium graminearum]CZS79680.1 unnamed protein product [Fusarium graminearum]
MTGDEQPGFPSFPGRPRKKEVSEEETITPKTESLQSFYGRELGQLQQRPHAEQGRSATVEQKVSPRMCH